MTTLAIFLLVLWLLGVLSGITLGGYIHALIGAVILMMVVRGTRHLRQVD